MQHEHFQELFADAEAGVHELPAELLAAYAAVQRLDAELAAADAQRTDPPAGCRLVPA
jgi:hypothetical protein